PVQVRPAAPASRVQIPSPFKFGSNEFGVKSEIYDYDERLERYRRIIAGFGHNGEVALRLLEVEFYSITLSPVYREVVEIKSFH
ncbi:MAG: hypothetical protein ABIM44_08060, partial [candidate division WOR-3 bacterium]